MGKRIIRNHPKQINQNRRRFLLRINLSVVTHTTMTVAVRAKPPNPKVQQRQLQSSKVLQWRPIRLSLGYRPDYNPSHAISTRRLLHQNSLSSNRAFTLRPPLLLDAFLAFPGFQFLHSHFSFSFYYVFLASENEQEIFESDKDFIFIRLPSELGSVGSMMPLHSAVASARLISSLSIESQSWGLVPQGEIFTLI